MKSTLLSQKITKLSLYVVGVFLVIVSTLGMYACTAVLAHTAINTNSHSEMKMNDCMENAPHSACAMDMDDHTEGWQVVVTSLLAQNVFDVFIAALLFVALSFILSRLKVVDSQIDSHFSLYTKAHPNIRLYNYLPQLFSRGILQPQLYA